jgi:hypothetical protein
MRFRDFIQETHNAIEFNQPHILIKDAIAVENPKNPAIVSVIVEKTPLIPVDLIDGVGGTKFKRVNVTYVACNISDKTLYIPLKTFKERAIKGGIKEFNQHFLNSLKDED